MKAVFILLPFLGLSAFAPAFVMPRLNVETSQITPEQRVMPTDPFVNDILTYTNIARKKKKLPPLVMKEGLNEIANGHSSDMATGRVPFSHDGFKSRYEAARVLLKNVYSFAENVSFGPHTGKEAVDGWMNSPHHRDNILGNYTSIGIGAVQDNKGTWYLTQVFCRE